MDVMRRNRRQIDKKRRLKIFTMKRRSFDKNNATSRSAIPTATFVNVTWTKLEDNDTEEADF